MKVRTPTLPMLKIAQFSCVIRTWLKYNTENESSWSVGRIGLRTVLH